MLDTSWMENTEVLKSATVAFDHLCLGATYPRILGHKRGSAGNFIIFSAHPLLCMDFSKSSLTISESKE